MFVGSGPLGPSTARMDGPLFFGLRFRHGGARVQELFKNAVVTFEAIAVMVLGLGGIGTLGSLISGSEDVGCSRWYTNSAGQFAL